MPRLPVPGPIVIPNCVEVRLVWSHPSGQFSNVLHGNLTAAGPINPTLPSTLLSGIVANAATTAWLTHVDGDTSLIGVTVKDLRAPNNPELPSTGTAASGTATDAPVPISNALVVTLRTGSAGRGFRGRVYLAGLTIGGLESMKQWLDTVGTAGVNFIAGVGQVLQTNSIPLVIAQRALAAGTDHAGNPLPARPAGVVPVISQDIANPRVDSQRRRLGR